MKQLLAIPLCALLLSPLPALAQDDPAPEPESGSENSQLMREGLRLLFEGLSGGLDETLEDMGEAASEAAPKLRDFVARMGPALIEALGKVGDLANYEAPVVLPNGDILIKRKDEAPDYLPPVPGENPDGSVDL
ncbi:hypothetical protein SAMN06297129_1034 [Pseudooceanicola antarcticus]|uniref:AAA+ family ATPase n=1 Tax=Pseudooceanicola antarcticus TaxID=1247613 RepID=A0A285IFM0_9RHOB|nr:hypothetical protein [Pseudooceanicola antarcticus]PJE29091.1 hypothetical protein CVM39_11665 [Pseudooceanicola antarcticus]SNY46790.1 hypothetical protein SAMN06297129_1034 [Pseudooceanicola antarcticus]